MGGFGGREGLVADCGGDAGEGEDGGGVVLRCLLDGGKWEVGKGWSLYVFVPGVEVRLAELGGGEDLGGYPEDSCA